MRYVRYIGPAHQRQITAREWAQAGIQAETVVWGPFNGFAVSLDQLTEDQIRKAIDPDPFLVITGESEDGDDKEFVPMPTQTETVTPAMLEAGRVDLMDDESRERATDIVTEDGQDPGGDRSTPRTTTGGGPAPVDASENVSDGR
ncbi:MAG: hypothetical protein ABW022_11065 [Actinoplanes sp.]